VANGDKTNSEPASTKYLGWRIASGALVVTLGLAAIVLSLHLVLDNYTVTATAETAGEAGGGETASASAASAVAVLTPLMAGILGIVGLFFGISATGSARGRAAEAEQTEAEAKVNPQAHGA
jgi:hypothetical protein